EPETIDEDLEEIEEYDDSCDISDFNEESVEQSIPDISIELNFKEELYNFETEEDYQQDIEILEQAETLEPIEDTELTVIERDEEGEIDLLEKIENLEDITDIKFNSKTEDSEEEVDKYNDFISDYKFERLADGLDLYIIGEEPEIQKESEIQGDDMFQKEQGAVSLEDFPQINFDSFEDAVLPSEVNNEESTPENFEEIFEENLKDFNAIDFLEDDLEELGDLDDLEELDNTYDDIPVVPDDFYDNIESKSDDLSKAIDEIEEKKSEFQLLIDSVYKEIQCSKLSLMIRVANNEGFIQTYQIGFDTDKVEQFLLSKDNAIVDHMYKTERIVYVSQINKIKSMFEERDFEEEFAGVKSLIIYPVKILGKVRALLFFGYNEDSTDKLETVINVLTLKKESINKGILKLM
ncbi:MAG TPA: hypothetical protein DC057_02590, partial [Spirochaetia bacterium]|nr:hypothetical protein [Spirochaetia bacterium]